MNLLSLIQKEPPEMPDDLPHSPYVLILGTGGSCLGAQALVSLHPERFFFMFPDADPSYFYASLELLEPQNTQVLCISKSGETMETLSQLLAVLEWLPSYENVRCITELRDSSLHRIATEYGLKVYNHPKDIGGRFSVFTLTGLIPLVLNGMSVELFWKGAQRALEEPVVPFNSAEHVLWIYGQRIRPLGDWWAQLVAESLGKIDSEGMRHGITPLLAYGTKDQHSQLQLYLDGPQNKSFTFVFNDIPPCPTLKGPDDLYLTHKSLRDVYLAHQRATYETLKNHGLPVRSFIINDEGDMGYFMMKNILEVLHIAKELHINPFDQPAVEEGKKKAMKYLCN